MVFWSCFRLNLVYKYKYKYTIKNWEDLNFFSSLDLLKQTWYYMLYYFITLEFLCKDYQQQQQPEKITNLKGRKIIYQQ